MSDGRRGPHECRSGVGAPGACAVEVENLSYTYPDGSPALDDISFRVETGESLAVVGANGAGKSTLLLHLNGCLIPQTGRVRVDGMAVTNHSLAVVRRTVGMLFQNPDDQLFMPTVFQDVSFGPLNMGLGLDEVEARAADALERVGAAGLAEKAPYHLSSGEKRTVAIATLLAMDPAILVMDEPSSGLDPGARRRLIHLLGGFGHTKILATHDLDLALEMCGRVVIISRGRIAADGDAALILEDERLLRSCGLELPLGLQGRPRGCRTAADAPR